MTSFMNDPVLPDFVVKRGVSFAEFVDVHEDNLLVHLFDAHQAPDEVLPQHVQHLNIVALGLNLKFVEFI